MYAIFAITLALLVIGFGLLKHFDKVGDAADMVSGGFGLLLVFVLLGIIAGSVYMSLSMNFLITISIVGALFIKEIVSKLLSMMRE